MVSKTVSLCINLPRAKAAITGYADVEGPLGRFLTLDVATWCSERLLNHSKLSVKQPVGDICNGLLCTVKRWQECADYNNGHANSVTLK